MRLSAKRTFNNYKVNLGKNTGNNFDSLEKLVRSFIEEKIKIN